MDDLDRGGHRETRAALRLVGPAVGLVGLIFVVIGVGSFFAAFGGAGPPRLFWCAFVGMPLLGVGIAITRFAYMGTVMRYMANEGAPVAKDAINYMAKGTRDSVRDIASAVRDGFGSGAGGAGDAMAVRCPKCNGDNEATANFCSRCGEALLKSKPCPDCGEMNDPDARFCDNCGRAIETGTGS